jgi:hypothetical protein
MKVSAKSSTLEALIAAIARSPIVMVPQSITRLPAGFDEVDVAILEWIAAEGRRFGQLLPLM